MPDWSDVIARARGLSAHLLGRPRLAEAARASTLAGVAELLVRNGYPEAGEQARFDPLTLERHTRRVAAQRLALLARWSGDRVQMLAPLYDDEDRRAIRAIVRGIVAGVPVEQRISGLVPTSSLPPGPLAELARQPNVSQVAALLVAWKHPFGAALLGEAIRSHPDPFRLEAAVDRRYAERALAAAADAGTQMERFVRFQIDVGNAWTAMALASKESESGPAELFIPGGNSISVEAYLDAARATTALDARCLLRDAARGTALSPVLADDIPRWRQQDVALAEALALLRRETRIDPLGVGVVVRYALSLRAEVCDLARIIWAVASGVPRSVVSDSLVTA